MRDDRGLHFSRLDHLCRRDVSVTIHTAPAPQIPFPLKSATFSQKMCWAYVYLSIARCSLGPSGYIKGTHDCTPGPRSAVSKMFTSSVSLIKPSDGLEKSPFRQVCSFAIPIFGWPNTFRYYRNHYTSYNLASVCMVLI